MRVSTCPGCRREVSLAEDDNRCDSASPGAMLYHSARRGCVREFKTEREADESGLSLCAWGGSFAPSLREVAP